jgi:hypothetical protein
MRYSNVFLLYTISIIVVLLCVAVVYEMREKTPIRLALFTEAAAGDLNVQAGGFNTFYSFDNRYEKLTGKIIFYTKFKNVDKNDILEVRVTDTLQKNVYKTITLADERTGKLELNIKEHSDFFRIQTKKNGANAITLERLEIEYNF